MVNTFISTLKMSKLILEEDINMPDGPIVGEQLLSVVARPVSCPRHRRAVDIATVFYLNIWLQGEEVVANV